jgi:hypothetical protein
MKTDSKNIPINATGVISKAGLGYCIACSTDNINDEDFEAFDFNVQLVTYCDNCGKEINS